MTTFTLRPIGHVRSPFAETSQIPKGCGAEHQAEGTIELAPAFAEGLADIDGFSHLYVLWVFDRLRDDDYTLTATPPTDGRRHGVFATRSPQRPNHLGLTVVRLLGRDGATLRVAGVDMLDGTPVVDIKPYLSNVPAGELRRGWLAEAEAAKAAAHWAHVYATKAVTDVSWYAPHLDDSLDAITSLAGPEARIIDVGGGASTLADDLMARGYAHVTVLDIAPQALDVSRARLGDAAARVEWIAGNIVTTDLGDRQFDLWHDRAVFHFLTDPAHRAAYVARLLRHVPSGGHVVIATFALDGPTKCSGLTIRQYDAASLARELGGEFLLVDATPVVHRTPSGTDQRFIRCRFRRR